MIPKGNLHLRLFIPYSITLIITITLAWWIATSVLAATLERRLDNQLVHATEVLAEGNIPLSDRLLQRLGRLLHSDFVLITSRGEIAMTTLPGDAGALHTGILTAWRTEPLVVQSTRLTEGAIPYLLVVHPLNLSRDNRYTAVAALAPLGDVRTAVAQAGWWLGAAALLGTLVLAWVGHLTARSLAIPIQQLSRMAERIAAGDRTVQAPLEQRNELGVLARALETMTRRLDIYEQEIAQQNRLAALGEMAARIAHEIRNPLTAIKMQIQLLEESPDTLSTRKTRRLQDEIRRLELIVSTTLALGREQQLQLDRQDLNLLVREVAELIAPQLEHRDIELETRLEALPETALDGDKAKQILFNLITNSVDALPEGGHILVHTRHDPAHHRLELQVEDSGSGIAPELQRKLFTQSVNVKESGLGVGLMLCRELVELHGGTITVATSTTLGGAKFTVRFPIIARL